MLRIPPAVEIPGLDLSEEMESERDAYEVSEANIAEARRLGLLND